MFPRVLTRIKVGLSMGMVSVSVRIEKVQASQEATGMVSQRLFNTRGIESLSSPWGTPS
jgi:hypothetical protein